MPHNPGGTGHRILEALVAGPVSYSDLRTTVGARSKHFGAVLHAMKVGGFLDHDGGPVTISDSGTEALAELRAGREVEGAKTSVRVFEYPVRRAA